jgi:hypothetical protein
MVVQIELMHIPSGFLQMASTLLLGSIASRFQSATKSVGRMVTILVLPGHDAKKDAVHIQHEFYGGVPYILRPTNWCTSQ